MRPHTIELIRSALENKTAYRVRIAEELEQLQEQLTLLKNYLDEVDEQIAALEEDLTSSSE